MTTPHLNRRRERFLPAREASAGVASQLDAFYSLRLIIENATRLLDADRGTLFLVDRQRGELWSLIAEGLGASEIRFPVTAGIAGHVASIGQSLNIKDAYADARFHRAVDDRTGYRTKTILCIPLRDAAERILGVLEIMNKRSGEFSGDDEAALGEFGTQAALLLSAQFTHEAHP